jgi:rhodanese-related sulfurtransferase
MKKRTAYLIFIALISLTAGYAQVARGDESGQPQSPQKAVKEVDAEEARVIIEEKKGSPDFVILDVRTDEEYSGGHIEGSTNIDVKSESFTDEVGKLDKSKTYIVHCRTGRRSETAVKIMEEMGFTDIYWMQDGIVGWQDAGYPVTK